MIVQYREPFIPRVAFRANMLAALACEALVAFMLGILPRCTASRSESR